MGTRISKHIGFFLHKKLARSVLVNNYKKIIEKLDYSENNEEDLFFNSLLFIAKNELSKKRLFIY